MRFKKFLAAVLLGLALHAAPALAQGNGHTLGGGQMSRDGKLLAFVVQGMPHNTFVVLEIDTGRSLRFELPPAHAEMRDLAWAQTSNTLLFVSLDPAASGSRLPDPSILGGWGTHIWSIAFGEDGTPQPASVIARGRGVRLPALSPDGTKVAYFHPVAAPGQEAMLQINPLGALAVFERDIASGEAVRVSDSQYRLPGELFYDGADAWLFSADEPAYVTRMGGSIFWSSTRPGAPPGKGTFDQLSGGIKSFRMERGEVLPDYPDFRQPWPAMGVAPVQSMLTGVTLEGEPILHGAPGPENTAASQFQNSASYYADGIARIEMKYGYIAFRADGEREVYFPPALPAAYDANTGGAGVDAAMKRYFVISMKADLNKADAGRSTSRLFLYEGQRLVQERDVSDIIAKAETVQIAE